MDREGNLNQGVESGRAELRGQMIRLLMAARRDLKDSVHALENAQPLIQTDFGHKNV